MDGSGTPKTDSGCSRRRTVASILVKHFPSFFFSRSLLEKNYRMEEEIWSGDVRNKQKEIPIYFLSHKHTLIEFSLADEGIRISDSEGSSVGRRDEILPPYTAAAQTPFKTAFLCSYPS